MSSVPMDTRQKTFAELQQEWIARRQQNPEDLFVDNDFPASLKPSVVLNPSSQDGFTLQSDAKSKGMQWKRCPAIAKSHNVRPQMVVEGITLFDLNQGRIGNCWYIAGSAHLAERNDLFKRVVPDDQDFEDRYAGIFHFRFYHFGEWADVVIDDFLPCYEDEQGKLQLFFIRNYREPGEFWSALLEKAYAKLYGSYEVLVGGFSRNAMVDVTGGVANVIDTGNLQDPNMLYQLLQIWVQRDTLFGAGITKGGMEEERKDGLLARHAYSIMNIIEVTDNNGQKHRLIKLRNPHGDKALEWNGKWSDKDHESWETLPSEIGSEMRHYNPADGNFWMSFEDFTRTFNLLEVCFVPLSPNRVGGKEGWNVFTFPRHAWVKGESSGGSANYWSNPQFRFDIQSDGSNDTMIYVSLTKITSRWLLEADADHITMNFDVYEMNDNSNEKLTEANLQSRAKLVAKGTEQSKYPFRELTKMVQAKPGRYCVVARTDNPNNEGRFVLRVVTETGVNVVNPNHDPMPTRHPVMPEKPRGAPPNSQIIQCLCMVLVQVVRMIMDRRRGR